jgi:Rieske Fe-S protein
MGSLSSCSSLPTFETDIAQERVRVPISAFGTSEVLVVRVRLLMYDLALRKHQDNTYTAVLLRCTHADTQLTPAGEGYVCNAHGSRFDLDGKVLKGPAQKDLEQFPIETIRGNIIVHFRLSLLR